MFGTGALCSYTANEKHKFGEDLNQAIISALKKHPDAVAIVVKVGEYKDDYDFGVMVSVVSCIQSHHFVIVTKLPIQRRPVIFRGERCPILM